MNFLSGLLKSAITGLLEDPAFTKWVDDRIAAAITSGESSFAATLNGEAERIIVTLMTKADAAAGAVTGDLSQTIGHLALDPQSIVQGVLGGLKGFLPFPFGVPETGPRKEL